MPVPSSVQIKRNGTDITTKVLYETAHFTAQASGGVGTFNFVVKDTAQTMAFTTGDQIDLLLDGAHYFGGYVMQIGKRYAFPAVDTTNVGAVTARQFSVQGTNYNVLFDRLVVRNTANYLVALPEWPGTTQAGTLVRDLAANYLDIPSGFNTTTYVDDVGPVNGTPNNTTAPFLWKAGPNNTVQGFSWRDGLRWVSQFNAALYYIDANKALHFHAPEKLFSRWGFSDRPNHITVSSSATTFTGATYGFREMETTEDINSIVNDVFVWGGSPLIASSTPGPSGTVFARRTNDASVAKNGRWQFSDPKFGTLGTQSGVDAEAETIVPPAGSGLAPGVSLTTGLARNRSVPANTLRLAWYAHDVPVLNGIGTTKDHLFPGQIVTIVLYVHGTDITHPLILTLVLRAISISFPTLPSNTGGAAKTYVRFEGDFGLALDDPFNIWEAIMQRRPAILRTVNTAGSATVEGAPGAVWQDAPDQLPDGSRKMFTLSSAGNPIIYTASSSEVYLNGLRLRQGADYSEQPIDGTITLFTAAPTGSIFWVIVRLAG